MTSIDGISWTERTSDRYALSDVIYGNGTFVAVGALGNILTSSNGISWTKRTSPVQDVYLQGVTYGDGIFVAIDNDGAILTSSDGINWTERPSGTTEYLYGVTYGDGTFVAVGSSGTILTSSDGTSWTERTSGKINMLRSVTYGNGTCIAVGEDGAVLQSGPIVITSKNVTTIANITNDEYVIQVLDSDGVAVAGATVTFDGNEGVTDDSGVAVFDRFTIGEPLITITKVGYHNYSNANTNYEKSDTGYETIVLYTVEESEYQLSTAKYVNGIIISDVLTGTKVLSMAYESPVIDRKRKIGRHLDIKSRCRLAIEMRRYAYFTASRVHQTQANRRARYSLEF